MSIKSTVEAALFVAGANLSVEKMAKVLNIDDVKSVKDAADELVKEYSSRDGGIEVYKQGKTYGMRVKNDLEDHVTALIPETEMPKAMLKVLALIAYEQPIKQSYIVKIRGNRVYEYLKRLEDMEFIERLEEGHTRIITTTEKFKRYFRINDAKELVKKPPEDVKEAVQTTI
jgi:segregation and condensation protein B